MRFFITGIAEYHYILVLNPMTSNTETTQVFGPFPDLLAVKAFYEGEKVEPYRDEGPDFFGAGNTKTYNKTFRKGGPLEWCNPIEFVPIDWANEAGFCNHYGQGVHLQVAEVTNIQRQQRID